MRLTTRNTETAGTGVEENIPFVIGVVAAAAEDGNEPTYADLPMSQRAGFRDAEPATTMSNVTIGPASRHARMGYPIVP